MTPYARRPTFHPAHRPDWKALIWRVPCALLVGLLFPGPSTHQPLAEEAASAPAPEVQNKGGFHEDTQTP